MKRRKVAKIFAGEILFPLHKVRVCRHDLLKNAPLRKWRRFAKERKRLIMERARANRRSLSRLSDQSANLKDKSFIFLLLFFPTTAVGKSLRASKFAKERRKRETAFCTKVLSSKILRDLVISRCP